MQAVRHHTNSKCILLYIERWIKAPIELADGTIKDRSSGAPQGGVISPILSNLFLHYVFDIWMTRSHPESLWCRYADGTPVQACDKWGASPLTPIVYSGV